MGKRDFNNNGGGGKRLGGGGGGGGGMSNKRRKVSIPHDDGGAGCSVFIGNLKYETKWQNLKDHMRKAGNVDSANILESNNGRSKGCAVVTYQHPKEARRAIHELNESLLDGRKIFVQEDSNPRDNNSNSNNNNNGGLSSNNEDSPPSSGFSVYVGNLPYECSSQALRNFFKTCGFIERAEAMEDPFTKKKRGWGIVHFSNDRAVETAIRKYHDVEFQGRTLEVRRDNKQQPQQQHQSNAYNTAGGGGDGDGNDEFRIYVGNLDYDCTWKELKDFAKNRIGGVVHADIPKSGFGIISFSSHRGAADCISKLNGSVFLNRPLEVRWDRKTGSSGGGESYRKPHSSSSSNSRQIYVGNLSYDCTWQNLKDAFKSYGNVKHAEMCETASGKSTGFGIVLFSDGRSAGRAISSMDGVDFQGRKLSVRLDRSPEKLEAERNGDGSVGHNTNTSRRDQRDNSKSKRNPSTTNVEVVEDKLQENRLDTALSCPR